MRPARSPAEPPVVLERKAPNQDKRAGAVRRADEQDGENEHCQHREKKERPAIAERGAQPKRALARANKLAA